MEVIRTGSVVALALFAILVLVLAVVEPLSNFLPDIRISSIPKVTSVPLAWFDLTFGMALLAIAE